MELIAHYRCRCGEGPLYDDRRRSLFWTDIDTGRLFRFDEATSTHQVIYRGERVGGFTLQEDGALLLFRVGDITRFDPDSGALKPLRTFSDPGVPRFNDTSAGPNGECYAGTMGHSPTSGGLFRLGLDGSIVELFRGTGCANGMGWTPDRRTMYWTCSSRNKIFSYDYDPATGHLTAERVFHDATGKNQGTCDGMTVDSQGNIYSARWGGHAVYIYRPDGTFWQKLDVPTEKVTSLCFGGDDLKTMYISTAGGDGQEAPGASPTAGVGGGTYRLRWPIAGQREFRSRIAIP